MLWHINYTSIKLKKKAKTNPKVQIKYWIQIIFNKKIMICFLILTQKRNSIYLISSFHYQPKLHNLFSSNWNVKFDKNSWTGFMLCVKFEISIYSSGKISCKCSKCCIMYVFWDYSLHNMWQRVLSFAEFHSNGSL